MEIEIRQHRALQKAVKSDSETVAYLLHFGTGFDEMVHLKE